MLSDIHANLEALEAVLEHLAPKRPDALWFLGDAVGYGGDPEPVVDWLRQIDPNHVVRGNHDKVVAGIEEPEGFSAIARDAALRTREMVSADGLAFLATLPQGPSTPKERFGICHGSWADEDYYIFYPDDAADMFDVMKGSVAFFGHTHRATVYANFEGATLEIPIQSGYPIILQKAARYVINPGSVGQPRDRDPRASYAMFDTESLQLAFFRVSYDIASAQQKIVKAGLPEINAARLSEGR